MKHHVCDFERRTNSELRCFYLYRNMVELVGWLGFPESIFLSLQNLELLLGFSSHYIQFSGAVIWGPHSLRQGVGMETRTVGHACLEYAS